MKYPCFLNQHDTIGICALSNGVGHKLKEFDDSITSIHQQGFITVETKSVRNKKDPAASSKVRAKELHQLLNDDSIKAIFCATGGDFQFEMMPYINYDTIKKNPKWIMGYSDPTSLLYTITTSCDIATLYGHNAGSFDIIPLHHSLFTPFSFLKGDIIEQQSFDLHEKNHLFTSGSYELTEKVAWIGEIETSGRCIGGCLDVLKDLFGTPYDTTKQFLDKYKEDGFIWYFDVFALDARSTYRTLLQMNMMNYFNNCKAIIIGRIKFPSTPEKEYYSLLKKAFDIPIIYQADIGHVAPRMTMINGAMMHLSVTQHKATLRFTLE